MRFTRRRFLESSLAAAATITVAGTKSSGKVLGANDTVRVGVAGLNGRGGSHVGAFVGMKNVEIAYLIDPHQGTYSRRSPCCSQSVAMKRVRCAPTYSKPLPRWNPMARRDSNSSSRHFAISTQACERWE